MRLCDVWGIQVCDSNSANVVFLGRLDRALSRFGVDRLCRRQQGVSNASIQDFVLDPHSHKICPSMVQSCLQKYQ